MTTSKTTITLGELANWQLHWMCCDIEFKLLKDPKSIDEVADVCGSILGRREEMMRQFDTIYDYPTQLRDEIQQSDNWLRLNELVNRAKKAALERFILRITDQARQQLGL